jgi:ribosomal protein L32
MDFETADLKAARAQAEVCRYCGKHNAEHGVCSTCEREQAEKEAERQAPEKVKRISVVLDDSTRAAWRALPGRTRSQVVRDAINWRTKKETPAAVECRAWLESNFRGMNALVVSTPRGVRHVILDDEQAQRLESIGIDYRQEADELIKLVRLATEAETLIKNNSNKELAPQGAESEQNAEPKTTD